MATLAIDQNSTAKGMNTFRQVGYHAQQEGFFAMHLEKHPGSENFTVDTLNLLVDDPENSCDFSAYEELFGWDDDIFRLLDWWHQTFAWIASLAVGLNESTPAQQEQFKASISAQSDFMALLPAALTAGRPYNTQFRDDFVPEAMRRYRIYTRSVCELARKTHPKIEWRDLDQLV